MTAALGPHIVFLVPRDQFLRLYCNAIFSRIHFRRVCSRTSPWSETRRLQLPPKRNQFSILCRSNFYHLLLRIFLQNTGPFRLFLSFSRPRRLKVFV